LRGLDNKKKIELAITGISIIVLIFLVIIQVSNSRERSRPFPANKLFSTSPAIISVAGEVGSGDNVKWGRDPFFMDSNNAIEQDMGDLILNGTVSDKNNPYAIVNNDIVKLGDKINGMVVIEINEKNVVLEQNGQKHTLELNIY